MDRILHQVFQKRIFPKGWMTALQLALGEDSVVGEEGTVACDHTWLVFQSIDGSNRSIKSAPSSRCTVSRLVTYTGWTSDTSLKCSFSMTLNVRGEVVWVKPWIVVLHRSTFNQSLVGFKALLRSLNNVWEMSDIVAQNQLAHDNLWSLPVLLPGMAI